MNKSIVSIVSDQTIPNYLFIKEFYQDGDELIFIASSKTANKIDYIISTLNFSPLIKKVILAEGDEERWEPMCHQIESGLSHQRQYAVNLTGGTKYMALAVQNVFEHFNSFFYYIPFPRNTMLSSNEEINVSTRINVRDYMALHGHTIRQEDLCRDYDNAKHMLSIFTNSLSDTDFEIIDKLREYRDMKKPCLITDIENPEMRKKQLPIPGLSAFLNKIGFVCKIKDTITKQEIKYLTGGWFEEYIYYLVLTELNPTDICFGVKLKSSNNDLDVVFTLGNKLFVIECKTGVEKGSLLNQIVYKSSALKEYLKGISAYSFIFALAKDDPEWSKVASFMGVGYYGRSFFIDSAKTRELVNFIKSKA